MLPSLNANGSCPYCNGNKPDYDIDCRNCRERFQFDHHQGRFQSAGKVYYTFEEGTAVLQARETDGD